MDQLLEGSYQIKAFRDLGLPYQMAVGHYMAIDGEAWADGLPPDACWPTREQQRKGLAECLPHLVELYGEVLFGVATVPSDRLRQALMQSEELTEGYPTWEAYQAGYLDAGDIPAHPATCRWPVVLSDFGDEVLQDGWHRLHCYLRRGDGTVPAVFYPREHHLAKS